MGIKPEILTKADTTRIIRGEAFDASFADYHYDKRFFTAKSILNKKVFTVKEAEVAYRVINHWDQAGLLPKGPETAEVGSWRRFTFIELSWIRVVMKLREFGLSLEKIARARERIMLWNAKNQCYPIFEYYIAQAWLSDADPYVLIWSDGHGEVTSTAEVELTKKLVGLDSDYLQISLKSILEELKLEPVEARFLSRLSENEEKIFSAIRNIKNKEVKIRTKSGNATELETTKIISENPLAVELDKEFWDNASFGEVTTKYADGKKQSAEVKQRERFD